MNGSDKPWTITTAGNDLTLPRWGYAVSHRERLVCASAVFGAFDQRVDTSFADGVRYVDSRGGRISLPDLTIQGSAIIRKENGRWYIIPATSFSELMLAPGTIDLPAERDADITALTSEGKPGPAPEVTWSGGMIHLKPLAQPVAKYRVDVANRGRPPG